MLIKKICFPFILLLFTKVNTKYKNHHKIWYGYNYPTLHFETRKLNKKY